MKGCRPLSAEEVRKVVQTFEGRYRERDRALFVLGVCCGFRISEMLSLRIGDVLQGGVVPERVAVRRCNTKNKTETRDVKLLGAARDAILVWVQLGLWQRGYVRPDTFIFKSQVGRNRPISRRHAYRVLKRNYVQNRMAGKLATHTMRKTYAQFLYQDLVERRAKGETVDPLPLTSKGLGHLNIKNTMKYLSFLEQDINISMVNFERRLFGADE